MDDFVFEDKYNLAEIYKLTSKTSKKSYIGQAFKYVCGNKRWGTMGRWKSHIYEAYNSEKDHCILLNNAIRKYTENDFIIEMIKDNVPINEIDELEIKLIKENNTMMPNGYNMREGGARGKLTKEMKIYKWQNKENYTIIRKYEEDMNLPMFMSAKRDHKGDICGYRIQFPIPDADKKIFKEFFVTDDKNREEVYKEAINFLNDTKIKHNFDDNKKKVKVIIKKNNKKEHKIQTRLIEKKRENYVIGYVVIYVENDTKKRKAFIRNNLTEAYDAAKNFYQEMLEKEKKQLNDIINVENNIETKDSEILLKKVIENKTKKQLNKLPEYVYPVYSKARLIGYIVKKYPKYDGNFYEDKSFTSLSSNQKNLAAAIRHIKDLAIKNKDAIFIEIIPDDLIENEKNCRLKSKKRNDTSKLPIYVAYVIVNGNKIGYQINNFPMGKETIKKKFCDTRQTMEEKYNMTLNFIRELWNKRKNIDQVNDDEICDELEQ